MLPILKNQQKQSSGLIVEQRKPDTKPDDQETGDEGIEACAQDLISAIHSKNTKGVASALKALFDIMESGGASDEESASPHTYADQNQAAAGQE